VQVLKSLELSPEEIYVFSSYCAFVEIVDEKTLLGLWVSTLPGPGLCFDYTAGRNPPR
jgi:hypothetical protein